MAMVSAKLSNEDDKRLREICETLRIDKSEAIRRATHQLWLALQIGKPFVERAGGRPTFLLNSGNRSASSRDSRRREVSEYLDERARKRRQSVASAAEEHD